MNYRIVEFEQVKYELMTSYSVRMKRGYFNYRYITGIMVKD